MHEQKKYILNGAAIAAKIERLAYELAEQNAGVQELVLAGIADNGVIIAHKLAERLKGILDAEVKMVTISLNKKKTEVVTIQPEYDLNGKTIIIIDDVSMTGSTMMYALKPLLPFHPAKIQTLVLVERQQKLFPMHSDYVGLHISTTLEDLIIVETDGEELTGAYLI
jgi:pyrimidine operon attenuation protein / uracil phosphoribosyltransferase